MSAKVVVEMDADEAKLFRKMALIERKQKKLASGLSGVAKQSNKAFGSKAVSDLKNYAAGFVGVGAAVGVVTAGLRDMRRLQDEAAQRAIQSEGGLANLIQLADNKPQLGSLVSKSKDLFRNGVGTTLGEASGVVFSLESAGLLRDAGLFKELAGRKIVNDAGSFAKSVATLITSIGAEEAGSVRDVVSKAFAASKASPSSVESLLQSAARAGVSARLLGVSDEELLAATALAAKATGSAEQGGTQINALLQSLLKQKGAPFKGKSLRESISQIQKRKLSDPELIKFFGRQEAATAFGVLSSNSSEFDKGVASISRAQDQDLIGKKLGLSESVPEINAARQSRIADARNKLSKQNLGSFTNLADAVGVETESALRNSGTSESFLFLRRSGRAMDRFLRGDEASVRTSFLSPDAKGIRNAVGDERFDELLNSFNQLLAKTEEQTQVIRDQFEKSNSSPALAPPNTDEKGN